MPSRFLNRRAVLRSLAGTSLLLPGILSQLLAAEDGTPRSKDPLAPKGPHFPAKAKRVIFLFSSGGVSHMDTFDYKPKLFQADGKSLGIGGGLSLDRRPLLKPRWEFHPGGSCGTLVSDLFPYIRQCMDDICLIHSMTTDNNEHFEATLAQLRVGNAEPEPAVVYCPSSVLALRGSAGLGQRFLTDLPPGNARDAWEA